MFTLALIALAVGVGASLKLGAEDRPGFDERRPLA
jgi:hypothetical protein